MYFDNITNNELEFFHNLKVPNFTIKLSDVLTSDLFRKETIIADSIYKIYPLFYCEDITSTNPNDKILESKCVICQKLDSETYLTFMSNDGDVQDYQNYASYFDVGDTLTTNQYNQIVSLLRSNVIMNDKIKINEEVNGTYGKYLFDIADTTVIDTGIVVTNETISAEPKIMLKDNVFHYAKYTLKLSVLHYNGAKIEDDDNTNYIVIDTLEIILEPNSWVNIPLEDLETDYIICLNADIEISFDVPVIPDWIQTLEVNAEPNIIQTNDTTEIYATGYDNGGLPVGSGHTVYFYEKIEPTITMSASADIIQTDDTTELYATVKDTDGSLARNVKVYFYKKE